jgi:hypothetical protein
MDKKIVLFYVIFAAVMIGGSLAMISLWIFPRIVGNARYQIKQDFSLYTAEQSIPYYVNHFVRKNQEHIDKLHMPIFQFHQH